MIKSTLIQQVAKRLPDLPEYMVTDGVNLLIEQMSNHLAAGNRIEIRGFGAFKVHFRGPRKARNPKTGQTLYTAAKYILRFKAGKTLSQLGDA